MLLIQALVMITELHGMCLFVDALVLDGPGSPSVRKTNPRRVRFKVAQHIYTADYSRVHVRELNLSSGFIAYMFGSVGASG